MESSSRHQVFPSNEQNGDQRYRTTNGFIANESQESAINDENNSFHNNEDNNEEMESAIEDNAKTDNINNNSDKNNSVDVTNDDFIEDDFFKHELFKNFGSKLKIWSERETEFLKKLEESPNPLSKLKAGDKQRLWEIRDKYKTLRRIRTGNTRRLLDQYENW